MEKLACTHVYTRVVACTHMDSHVLCVLTYSHVYSCVLACTHMCSCVLMCNVRSKYVFVFKFVFEYRLFCILFELEITKGHVFVFYNWSVFLKYVQIQLNTHKKLPK